MQNRLRSIRKARGLTLADVANLCTPATSAVTIGRLETGTRQLTLQWLERLSQALNILPQELLVSEGSAEIPVSAQLTAEGAQPLSRLMQLSAPVATAGTIGLIVKDSQGDYRAGDELWLDQLPPEAFPEAINADILVPRSVGRFAFGRLIATDGKKLHLLPATPGSRQTIIADAPWIGKLKCLIRHL